MREQKINIEELLKQTREILLQSQQQLEELNKPKKKEKETADQQYDRYKKDCRIKSYTLSEAIESANDITTDDYTARVLSELLAAAKERFNGDNLLYYRIEFFVPYEQYQNNKRIEALYFSWLGNKQHHKRTAALIAANKAPAFPIEWISYDEVVNMAMTPGIDIDYQRRALLSLFAAKKKATYQKAKGRKIGLDITQYRFLLSSKRNFPLSFD